MYTMRDDYRKFPVLDELFKDGEQAGQVSGNTLPESLSKAYVLITKGAATLRLFSEKASGIRTESAVMVFTPGSLIPPVAQLVPSAKAGSGLVVYAERDLQYVAIPDKTLAAMIMLLPAEQQNKAREAILHLQTELTRAVFSYLVTRESESITDRLLAAVRGLYWIREVQEHQAIDVGSLEALGNYIGACRASVFKGLDALESSGRIQRHRTIINISR